MDCVWQRNTGAHETLKLLSTFLIGILGASCGPELSFFQIYIPSPVGSWIAPHNQMSWYFCSKILDYYKRRMKKDAKWAQDHTDQDKCLTKQTQLSKLLEFGCSIRELVSKGPGENKQVPWQGNKEMSSPGLFLIGLVAVEVIVLQGPMLWVSSYTQNMPEP